MLSLLIIQSVWLKWHSIHTWIVKERSLISISMVLPYLERIVTKYHLFLLFSIVLLSLLSSLILSNSKWWLSLIKASLILLLVTSAIYSSKWIPLLLKELTISKDVFMWRICLNSLKCFIPKSQINSKQSLLFISENKLSFTITLKWSMNLAMFQSMVIYYKEPISSKD